MLKGLTSREARTDAHANDPDLCGRTYAIPFGTVWDAAVALAKGGLKGWQIVGKDECAGVIVAHVDSRVLPFRSRVDISIGLDDNAQTRVDARAQGRDGGINLGTQTRRIRRLLRSLDLALAVEPRQILDGRTIAADATAVEA